MLLDSSINNDVLIKGIGNEYYYYDKVNELYYSSFIYKEEEIDERIDNQVTFFNKIANKYDTYMYIVPTLALTDIKDSKLKDILLIGLFVISVIFILSNTYHPFIYSQF